MNIVHCARHPKLERLEIVQKLRLYFMSMVSIGPAPERVAMWPEQMNLLLNHGAASKRPAADPGPREAELHIDGLPAVTLVEYIEIDERVTEEVTNR